MIGFRRSIPWWLKIGVKIAMSRALIPYGFWKRLRLFEHGDMNNPQRAYEIFISHAKTANILVQAELPHLKIQNRKEFSVLELGPGDSLFTAIIAKALGASHSWLVDSGDFATRNYYTYVKLWKFLLSKGYVLPLHTVPESTEKLIDVCNGKYLTGGVNSLAQIPDNSVDFCFSNAVLEHVLKIDFSKLMYELRRVLKVGGICVHRVDLKDHLSGGLNNLRFSEGTWESSLFKSSGFYTNRIRFHQMRILFEQANFDCQFPRIMRWNQLPINRSVLAAPFCHFSDDELMVSGFDVVLRKKDGS